jgi:hypothetical protein
VFEFLEQVLSGDFQFIFRLFIQTKIIINLSIKGLFKIKKNFEEDLLQLLANLV